MTKEEFLNDFHEINFMYNNPMMKASLERHIDALLESQTGRWEARYETRRKYKSFETYESFEGYFCSRCGKRALAEGASDEADDCLSKYCLWCGARMEEE